MNTVHTSSLTAAWLFPKMTHVFKLQLLLFYSLLCFFIKVTLCFSYWRYIFFIQRMSGWGAPWLFQHTNESCIRQSGSFQIYLNSSLMFPLDLWCFAVPIERSPVGVLNKGQCWLFQCSPSVKWMHHFTLWGILSQSDTCRFSASGLYDVTRERPPSHQTEEWCHCRDGARSAKALLIRNLFYLWARWTCCLIEMISENTNRHMAPQPWQWLRGKTSLSFTETCRYTLWEPELHNLCVLRPTGVCKAPKLQSPESTRWSLRIHVLQRSVGATCNSRRCLALLQWRSKCGAQRCSRWSTAAQPADCSLLSLPYPAPPFPPPPSPPPLPPLHPPSPPPPPLSVLHSSESFEKKGRKGLKKRRGILLPLILQMWSTSHDSLLLPSRRVKTHRICAPMSPDHRLAAR